MMKRDDKTERQFVVTSNNFTEIHILSETAYLALKQIQILLNIADVDYFIHHQDPGVLQLFFNWRFNCGHYSFVK